MEIPPFTAFCILPDTENFVGYSLQNPERKPIKGLLTIEQVDTLLTRSHTVRLVRHIKLGYILKSGSFYVKTDLKKTKVLLKACKIKMNRRITATKG